MAQVLWEIGGKLREPDGEIAAFIEDETFLETYAVARRIHDRRARGKAEVKGDVVKEG